jgi:hypothetical protein
METHFPLPASGGDRELAATLGTNRAFHAWRHRSLYSRYFLSWTLSQHGYEAVEFCEYGESDHEQFRRLEMHGGYRKTPMRCPTVWIVEAQKAQRR